LTILIADWGLNPVKALLNKVNVPVVFSGLDKMILVGGKPMAGVYKFNWLAATGTSILIAAIISAFILRVGPGRFLAIFWETLKNLRFALVTIACVLAFAYVANWSGMTTTMGKAFTVVGAAFPFVAAFLGWLGVFITGSDTSSNALFCNMQKVTAESLNINPVLTVATNSAGGVAGKMISPQNIVVGASSTGLIGREGDLFRFTVWHSIFFTAFIGVIATLQAYVFPGMIPPAVKAAAAAAAAAKGGAWYLLISAVIVLVIGAVAYRQANGALRAKV
ncbi:MAG: L-lactate permease, partial [Bacillota bacterium]